MIYGEGFHKNISHTVVLLYLEEEDRATTPLCLTNRAIISLTVFPLRLSTEMLLSGAYEAAYYEDDPKCGRPLCLPDWNDGSEMRSAGVRGVHASSGTEGGRQKLLLGLNCQHLYSKVARSQMTGFVCTNGGGPLRSLI